MEKFLRKLLNLPEKKPKPAETEATVDPWNQAAAAAKNVTTQKNNAAWSPVEVQPRAKLWHRIVRGLVIAVLVFFLLAGMRTVLFPSKSTATAPAVPSTVYFPNVAAGGVAERYVSSYYTWDENDKDKRARALSLDSAGGQVESGAFGWDNKGKQTVNSTNVVAVKPESDSVGTVTVRYTATPYKLEKKEWKPQAQQVRAADVKIQVINDRVAVIGTPALVSIPEASSAPLTDQNIMDDPAITESTSEYATTFFKAYGSETDVSALTAPGAQIAGMGGTKLERVVKWTVLTGEADQRHAVATVKWKLNDATTLDQSYDVTLKRVTSGQTERWQVAAIQGK